MNEADPQDCLGSTSFIDSDSHAIRDRLGALNLPPVSQTERAIALFDFVRDAIAYEFTTPADPAAYRASAVLANGRGHCVRKAVLLCGLARAAGIPAALVFADLRDCTMPESTVEMMGTDILHHHGLVAFHLQGRWLKADPTTTAETARRKGFQLVVFDGTRDALGHGETEAGQAHLEYVRIHGMHADLPFVEVMRSLAEGYAKADREKFYGLGLTTADDFARAAERYARE